MDPKFGVLILAGGKSERMNFPKSHLQYKGRTFLRSISEGYYKAGMKNICLVIRKEHCEGEWKEPFDKARPFIRIIEKTDSFNERFYSIKTGLKNFEDVDFCFIHNVDNPFINGDTIKSLSDNRYSDGYTVLFHNGRRGHPLLISKKIISRINSMDDGDHNLKNILMEFPKIEASVNNEEILLNINTKEDYAGYIENSEWLCSK